MHTVAVVLPVVAGAAIALQTVLNSLGMRFLGLGGLIGFSGLVTSLLGFAAAAVFLARPEVMGRARLSTPWDQDSSEPSCWRP